MLEGACEVLAESSSLGDLADALDLCRPCRNLDDFKARLLSSSMFFTLCEALVCQARLGHEKCVELASNVA